MCGYGAGVFADFKGEVFRVHRKAFRYGLAVVTDTHELSVAFLSVSVPGAIRTPWVSLVCGVGLFNPITDAIMLRRIGLFVRYFTGRQCAVLHLKRFERLLYEV